MCGATVISTIWAVTAAHCVTDIKQLKYGARTPKAVTQCLLYKREFIKCVNINYDVENYLLS